MDSYSLPQTRSQAKAQGNSVLKSSANEEEVREMNRLERKRGTWRKWTSSIVYAYGMLTFVWPVRAFAAIAAGGALPWDQPLTTLQTDLQGPVAHAITTAAVIGTGIM